jgi:hypothetical protein
LREKIEALINEDPGLANYFREAMLKQAHATELQRTEKAHLAYASAYDSGRVDVGGPGGGTVEPAQPGLTDRRGKEEETSSQVAFTSLPRAFSVRTSASDQAQSPRKKCAQTRHSPKAGFVSPLPGAKQVYPALKLPHSRH